MLYSMVSGDPGNPLYFPLNGFQWIKDKGKLAVRVRNQNTKGALIDLYLFNNEPMNICVKTFLLESGNYDIEIKNKDSKPVYQAQQQVADNDGLLDITIPGSTELVLSINQV